MTTLQEAYDSAAVVFSKPLRFVEWKFVIPSENASVPFGDKGQDPAKAVREIDGERWIYVFRHDGSGYAALKEVIRLDPSRDLYTTPMSPEKAGAAVLVGKNMRLPRRVLGVPKVYRIYASRVKLDKARIEALEATIHKFAPKVLLEPTQNNSVLVGKDELLVPVVDPITITQHLHAAYEAAANDLLNYTTPHAGLSSGEYRRVTQRRKKHLLARLMKGLIGEKENDNDVTSKLVHELKDMQVGIESFLLHYEEQVRARSRHRDHMANLLVKWLGSDAMRVAAQAHRVSGEDPWVRFLVVWCHALKRLNESLPGRNYVTSLLKDDKHFVRTYVWPSKDLSNDQFQAVRKGGLSVLDAWGVLAEAHVLTHLSTDVSADVVTTLRRLRRWKVDTSKFTAKHVQEIAGLDRTIRATKLILPAEVAAEATLDFARREKLQHFEFDADSLGLIIETVNLVFAIQAASEQLKSADPKERELAVVSLVGSSLDAASALGSVLKISERRLAVLGFASGVIDVYLGVQDMNKAYKQGDQGAADGAFVTAVGASISTSAALMLLMAIPGAQVVGAIGLAVTALGSIYKMINSKSDLDMFFLRSSWGTEFGKPGQPDWSPVNFEKWKTDSDKSFDYQLEALLNILCKIGDQLR
ncbi:MAG: hypothetical protein QM756_34965 [Polyangiaceae bacterium]